MFTRRRWKMPFTSSPEVSETAVIGIKDEKWGEVGKAVVVLKEGETSMNRFSTI
jgi:acyl-CoA synthetase (AMP-forming)/AMP-acid ligase II